MKALLVVFSYHHMNTEKVAGVFARVLDAQIRAPQQISPDELGGYDLVGFGAGIDSGRHYQVLLDFADGLPRVAGKRAFIFSTAGITGKEKVDKDHSALREKLLSKGYVIVGEFGCLGLDTNSFLKFFGGINKGRPDAGDLKRAEEFAENLRRGM